MAAAFRPRQTRPGHWRSCFAGPSGLDPQLVHQLLEHRVVAVDHGLEDTGQQVSSRGVFETTLSTLGEGGAQGTCNDDIIGVLLGEGGGALFASTEVGRDLVQTVLG